MKGVFLQMIFICSIFWDDVFKVSAVGCFFFGWGVVSPISCRGPIPLLKNAFVVFIEVVMS